MISPDSAYPLLPVELSQQELSSHFSPSEAELILASQKRQPLARLTFLAHLKLAQRLGYFISLKDAPEALLKHLSAALKLKKHPTKKEILALEASGSRSRQLIIIREYIGIKPFSREQLPWLEKLTFKHAQTKESVNDIINVMLEELVHHCYELPGLSSLQIMAQRIRTQVNDGYFKSISEKLSNANKERIKELLSKQQSDPSSLWQTLKREPKKPTNKEVRSYLQHVHWLRDLGESLPVPEIPSAKLKQFTLEARALDAHEMSELTENKRYALASILIRSQHSKALDDVATIFVKLIRKLIRSGQVQLDQYLLKQRTEVEKLIDTFKSVLEGYQQGTSNKSRIEAIENVIGNDVESYIERCEEHMAYAGNNYVPFLLKPYQQKRSLLMNCLKILEIKSTSSDKTTELLTQLLRSLSKSHKLKLSREELEAMIGQPFKEEWLPERWQKMVFERQKHARSYDAVDRKHLELAIMVLIKQELGSADLYIPNSAEYDDYREQLVNDDELAEEMPIFSEQVGLPLNSPKEFTQHIKAWLTDMTKQADENFPANAYASIINDRISIKKITSKGIASNIEFLDDWLTKNLPPVSIVDILTDVEKWLNLHKKFGPLSGNLSRISNRQKRFIATLFCYGCNLGPVQTAKSIKEFSRRQVSWLNLKHSSPDKLQAAITEVINQYKQLDLPGYWGKGLYASADGTIFDLFEENLISEYHIRYGGYGGIGYYHVADSYIALFSHFIPCGAYEAIYILDGLIKNESEIQPNTVHGDTQAQSYTVFGLSYLLGINLMPRIRGLSDLQLFRPDKRYKYKNIDTLFKGGAIDFKLIERHFMDMMRIVISIKKGKISPSAILRRLGTHSKKNKLYLAFRELGKVVRTVFLLRYINEVELRQTIQAATNKSEEFNGFTKWLFFGGDGIIAENLRPQQDKLIKYNHLVSNMVILHNAENMTRSLKKFVKEGHELTPEMLAGLSPYRRAHINRFGDYHMDINRNISPIGTPLIFPENNILNI